MKVDFGLKYMVALITLHFFHISRVNSKEGKRHKGRNSAVQSSLLSWAGQYKKCVQYNFKFTPVYI